MTDILTRIHALRGSSKLYLDRSLQAATDNFSAKREIARYAKDDLRAATKDDIEAGRIQSSAAADAAQDASDRATADLGEAWAKLNAERERFGKVFLANMSGTAAEIGELTLALSNALEAIRNHAWGIAAFAQQNGLPVHRAIDHAANVGDVARRLKEY